MGELEISSVGREPRPDSPSRDLIVIVPHPDARPADEPRTATADRLFSSPLHYAAAAALAIVVAVAGALFVEDQQQAKALVERAAETEFWRAWSSR